MCIVLSVESCLLINDSCVESLLTICNFHKIDREGGRGEREGEREHKITCISYWTRKIHDSVYVHSVNLPKSAASSKVFILYQCVSTVDPSAV